MNAQPIKLIVSDLPLAVCRLGGLIESSAGRFRGRSSRSLAPPRNYRLFAPKNLVPVDVQAERGWLAVRVAGVIDFSVTGVLAGLTAPLAEDTISVFAISTYDTDYVLVKEHDLGRAIEKLREAGHVLDR